MPRPDLANDWNVKPPRSLAALKRCAVRGASFRVLLTASGPCDRVRVVTRARSDRIDTGPPPGPLAPGQDGYRHQKWRSKASAYVFEGDGFKIVLPDGTPTFHVRYRAWVDLDAVLASRPDPRRALCVSCATPGDYGNADLCAPCLEKTPLVF